MIEINKNSVRCTKCKGIGVIINNEDINNICIKCPSNKICYLCQNYKINNFLYIECDECYGSG